jgi:nicotinamide riboside transporter PnuC
MDLLSLIGSIIAILGNILVILKYRIGFLIWTFFGNSILGYLAYQRNDLPQVGLFFVYSAINLFGFWFWGKKKNTTMDS